jgi:uncharacterized protein (TIGR02646 family)
MIFVKKPTPEDLSWKALLALAPILDAEWSDLIDKARVGRVCLIDDFENDKDIKINAAIYSRYKDFLIRLFDGKCAYCESKFTVSQPGDVEHFRPKGRVVDDNFKPIRVQHPKKGEIEHPGYYWLAYEWKNLLPSCADCNRFRQHGVRTAPQGGAGKADRFPLKDEKCRAVVPDGEVIEEAMLINPCEVDPDLHFEFLSTGTIKPKTPEGEVTLKLLGLNLREDLVEARATAFDDAEGTFERYMTAIISREPIREKRFARRVNRMLDRKEAYSAMQILAIVSAVRFWAQRNVKIELPLPDVD